MTAVVPGGLCTCDDDGGNLAPPAQPCAWVGAAADSRALRREAIFVFIVLPGTRPGHVHSRECRQASSTAVSEVPVDSRRRRLGGCCTHVYTHTGTHTRARTHPTLPYPPAHVRAVTPTAGMPSASRQQVLVLTCAAVSYNCAVSSFRGQHNESE